MTTAARAADHSTAPDVRPAHEQIAQMALGHLTARALYGVVELGIPDRLAAGPRSADDLAAEIGAHGPSLHRLLRLMASLGFFEEDASARFALTPLGAALQTGAPGYASSLVHTLAGPIGWDSIGLLSHAVRTGEPAADKALGASIFDYLAARPVEATRFNELMIAFHGAEPPAVAAAYDFSAIGTLVDVGGGTGNLLTTILLAYPGVSGLLYDLPHVAAEARERIASRGLTDRCGVAEGSFFDGVPEGGDAYMLSHIIHDWDEARCLTILGHCRRAMGRGGRVLLVEMVVPGGNVFHQAKLSDLVMLTFTPGGRERTEQEYAALFAKAGLRLTSVTPTASAVSVIEAVAD
jgi:hypothetical protein